ncbi:hypothetical protein CCHR01_03567 [Colletotrichum chrysophilum]|uniref:Uncharacterized protein n=1 Tax=Colletotrichum chrysophilum TaxID=1836956 RepID=A0AAD9AY41_9PEZI|nr:hypothetical protein CCHR01_03567 [Colletotrichum chrysophilum]
MGGWDLLTRVPTYTPPGLTGPTILAALWFLPYRLPADTDGTRPFPSKREAVVEKIACLEEQTMVEEELLDRPVHYRPKEPRNCYSNPMWQARAAPSCTVSIDVKTRSATTAEIHSSTFFVVVRAALKPNQALSVNEVPPRYRYRYRYHPIAATTTNNHNHHPYHAPATPRRPGTQSAAGALSLPK